MGVGPRTTHLPVGKVVGMGDHDMPTDCRVGESRGGALASKNRTKEKKTNGKGISKRKRSEKAEARPFEGKKISKITKNGGREKRENSDKRDDRGEGTNRQRPQIVVEGAWPKNGVSHGKNPGDCQQILSG